MMSAYLILDIDVSDPEKYKDYVAVAPDFVRRYQGTYLVRGGDPENREGEWHPSRIVVLSFPSREQARALLDDPGYRAVAEIRWTSTVSKAVLVDGFDDTGGG
jgi:uncharacterized protein (DUF1330 family)